MKILNVVGARPNFMKIAPIVDEMKRAPELSGMLVHTGQHYDEGMSEVFFRELGIPRPDVHLDVGSGSHAEQTARIMVEFEKVCLKEQPELILVVGDVRRWLAVSLRPSWSFQSPTSKPTSEALTEPCRKKSTVSLRTALRRCCLQRAAMPMKIWNAKASIHRRLISSAT